MYFIIFTFLTLFCLIFGCFGFCQIVGSLQQIRNRGFKLTFITISIWVIILGGIYLLFKNNLPKYLFSLYFGYGYAFVATLSSGRIE